jgi:hypothetical protein
MGDRLLRYMADQAQPVRLYSPNPDAPQWSGLPATEEPRPPLSSRLWNAVKNAPGQLWGMLPAEARKAYTSGFHTAVDMSTPASVRDYTNSAQDTVRSAAQGDGWGTATNALATVNAALGAIPVAGMGVTLARKGAQEVGQAVGKEAGNVIRAYHGSPHSFDKFDLSKIGTGEGAQAYGHGLYFAENEGVAKGYRDTLSSKLDYAGREQKRAMDFDDAWTNTAKMMFEGGYSPAEIENVLRGTFKSITDDGVALAMREANPGSMYEVTIHADPAKFLDWDKPLAQQHPDVRDAVNRVARSPEPYGLDRITDDMRGVEMQKMLRDPEAVKALNAAGVPGIQYLDAGSRVAGEGSRNYVAFDDSLIEILRKYGLLPFAGAAGYAALPNDAAPEAR